MNLRKALAGAVFASGLLVAYNCGGGGGGGGTETSTLDLYLTDQTQQTFPVRVDVTIKRIDACVSQAECYNVFSSSAGVVVNIAQLNRSLHFLSSISVPNGTYDFVKVRINSRVKVAYLNEQPNDYDLGDGFNCSGGECEVTVDLSPNVTVTGPINLVLDFDLRSLDCSSGTCTLQIIPRTKSDDELRSEYRSYELYGLVNVDSITDTGIKVLWGNMELTGYVKAGTSCEINGQQDSGPNCLTRLRDFVNGLGTQVCVEVEAYGDPSTRSFDVNEFKVRKPEKCGLASNYSVTDPEDADEFELKGYIVDYQPDTNQISFKFDPNDTESLPLPVAADATCKRKTDGDMEEIDCGTLFGNLFEGGSTSVYAEIELQAGTDGPVVKEIEIY